MVPKSNVPTNKAFARAAAKKRLFEEAYLTNGNNATQAAITAGYSAKTAGQAGARLLKDVQILDRVALRRAELIETMELTTERTLREIARLAYFDPRKLLDSSGRPKPLHELDDDTAAAIAGMEVQDKYDKAEDGGAATVSTIIKYKLADKNAALEKAMKHLGQYEQDNKQRNLLEGIDRDTMKVIAEKLRGL